MIQHSQCCIFFVNLKDGNVSLPATKNLIHHCPFYSRYQHCFHQSNVILFMISLQHILILTLPQIWFYLLELNEHDDNILERTPKHIYTFAHLHKCFPQNLWCVIACPTQNTLTQIHIRENTPKWHDKTTFLCNFH